MEHGGRFIHQTEKQLNKIVKKEEREVRNLFGPFRGSDRGICIGDEVRRAGASVKQWGRACPAVEDWRRRVRKRPGAGNKKQGDAERSEIQMETCRSFLAPSSFQSIQGGGRVEPIRFDSAESAAPNIGAHVLTCCLGLQPFVSASALSERPLFPMTFQVVRGAT